MDQPSAQVDGNDAFKEPNSLKCSNIVQNKLNNCGYTSHSVLNNGHSEVEKDEDGKEIRSLLSSTIDLIVNSHSKSHQPLTRPNAVSTTANSDLSKTTSSTKNGFKLAVQRPKIKWHIPESSKLVLNPMLKSTAAVFLNSAVITTASNTVPTTSQSITQPVSSIASLQPLTVSSSLSSGSVTTYNGKCSEQSVCNSRLSLPITGTDKVISGDSSSLATETDLSCNKGEGIQTNSHVVKNVTEVQEPSSSDSDSSDDSSSDEDQSSTCQMPGKLVLNIQGDEIPRQLMMLCRVKLKRLNPASLPSVKSEGLFDDEEMMADDVSLSDSAADSSFELTNNTRRETKARPLSKMKPTTNCLVSAPLTKVKSVKSLNQKSHAVETTVSNDDVNIIELLQRCQHCRVILEDCMKGPLKHIYAPSIHHDDSDVDYFSKMHRKRKKKEKKERHKKYKPEVEDEKPSRTKNKKHKARSERKRIVHEESSDEDEKSMSGHSVKSQSIEHDEKLSRVEKVRLLAEKAGKGRSTLTEKEEAKEEKPKESANQSSYYISPWSEAIATSGMPKIPKIKKAECHTGASNSGKGKLGGSQSNNPYDRVIKREARRREFERQAAAKYGQSGDSKLPPQTTPGSSKSSQSPITPTYSIPRPPIPGESKHSPCTPQSITAPPNDPRALLPLPKFPQVLPAAVVPQASLPIAAETKSSSSEVKKKTPLLPEPKGLLDDPVPTQAESVNNIGNEPFLKPPALLPDPEIGDKEANRSQSQGLLPLPKALLPEPRGLLPAPKSPVTDVKLEMDDTDWKIISDPTAPIVRPKVTSKVCNSNTGISREDHYNKHRHSHTKKHHHNKIEISRRQSTDDSSTHESDSAEKPVNQDVLDEICRLSQEISRRIARRTTDADDYKPEAEHSKQQQHLYVEPAAQSPTGNLNTEGSTQVDKTNYMPYNTGNIHLPPVLPPPEEPAPDEPAPLPPPEEPLPDEPAPLPPEEAPKPPTPPPSLLPPPLPPSMLSLPPPVPNLHSNFSAEIDISSYPKADFEDLDPYNDVYESYDANAEQYGQEDEVYDESYEPYVEHQEPSAQAGDFYVDDIHREPVNPYYDYQHQPQYKENFCNNQYYNDDYNVMAPVSHYRRLPPRQLPSREYYMDSAAAYGQSSNSMTYGNRGTITRDRYGLPIINSDDEDSSNKVEGQPSPEVTSNQLTTGEAPMEIDDNSSSSAAAVQCDDISSTTVIKPTVSNTGRSSVDQPDTGHSDKDQSNAVHSGKDQSNTSHFNKAEDQSNVGQPDTGHFSVDKSNSGQPNKLILSVALYEHSHKAHSSHPVVNNLISIESHVTNNSNTTVNDISTARNASTSSIMKIPDTLDQPVTTKPEKLIAESSAEQTMEAACNLQNEKTAEQPQSKNVQICAEPTVKADKQAVPILSKIAETLSAITSLVNESNVQSTSEMDVTTSKNVKKRRHLSKSGDENQPGHDPSDKQLKTIQHEEVDEVKVPPIGCQEPLKRQDKVSNWLTTHVQNHYPASEIELKDCSSDNMKNYEDAPLEMLQSRLKYLQNLVSGSQKKEQLPEAVCQNKEAVSSAEESGKKNTEIELDFLQSEKRTEPYSLPPVVCNLLASVTKTLGDQTDVKSSHSIEDNHKSDADMHEQEESATHETAAFFEKLNSENKDEGEFSHRLIPGLNVMESFTKSFLESREDYEQELGKPKYHYPLSVPELSEELSELIKVILDNRDSSTVLKALVRTCIIYDTEKFTFNLLKQRNPHITDLNNIYNKALINLIGHDDLFRLVTAAGILHWLPELEIHPLVQDSLLKIHRTLSSNT